MISKCKFCDYTKTSNGELSILRKAHTASKRRILEDQLSFGQLYAQSCGTHDWNSVKVHMGRMHKDDTYYGIWPDMQWTPEEKEAMRD